MEISKVNIIQYLEGVGEDIGTQPVVVSFIPTEHLSALTAETFRVDDSAPELAGEGIVTVGGVF